ncbi:hypothetical protein AALB39_09180 [Lachnospiraceae bacterium 54-53]
MTILDITQNAQGRQKVSFDLPEGEWKLLILVSTDKGGEPHYEHYKEEFGKTILGFFSDEPRFGNVHGPYGSIGRMDLVSDLYSRHFSRRIGNWCHARGVRYIGHTIEDNNAHARLGYGAGHFFKAMAGQDMAGIDVVLHQLMPGMDHGFNKAMTKNGWDGEFFH